MSEWKRIKKLLGQFPYATLVIRRDKGATHTGVTVSARCKHHGQLEADEFYTPSEIGNSLDEALKWLESHIEKDCCQKAKYLRQKARAELKEWRFGCREDFASIPLGMDFLKIFEGATHCTCGKPLKEDC